MKIIILGAGQVGSTLAENLASEANDITLVDSDPILLDELRDRLDIQTVVGSGSHPEVLEKAGIQDADMLIAVTTHDEVNMVACQIAHSLYHTPHKIARIRSVGYTNDRIRNRLFGAENMPVDVAIAPEQLVTEHLAQLISQPGALQVLDFADKRVQLVAVRAATDAPMVGKEIRELTDHLGSRIEARVAAIYRRDRAIIPTGDTRIEAGDEVFFLAASKHIRQVMAELANKEKAYKRIVIAGGGNIGYRLAKTMEHGHQIKIVEMDANRCAFLAENLDKTIVLNGSASDRDLLHEEGIETVDVFLALTNNDAANIISSMLAKRMGAGKVITLINNPVYVDLMQTSDIDIAIAPSQITTSALLSFVRRGDTVRVHSLRRGAAEAMEVVAHGDARSSKVVGRRISEIKLPEGATIGAVVRNLEDDPQVIMGSGDVLIEDRDHLIIFLSAKEHVRKIEQLFQVGFTFF
jgi:trk system potassium uptake protein